MHAVISLHEDNLRNYVEERLLISDGAYVSSSNLRGVRATTLAGRPVAARQLYYTRELASQEPATK